MYFEDGSVYEYDTPIGRLTFVCDAQADIPIRIYGPNGLQLDPLVLAKMGDCPKHGWHAGYMAWDLSRLAL